uniref:Nudix hydrolase domain-containing protein n=1 Tax=Ditylum brightwellii TaxID=49249 RepID=A0A7S4WGM8_9STRA
MDKELSLQKDLFSRIKELDGTRHAHLYVAFVVCGVCVGQVLQCYTDMLITCRINRENPTCFQLIDCKDDNCTTHVLAIINDKTTEDRNMLMNEATNILVRCGLIPKKHGELFSVSRGWCEDSLCVVDRNAAPFFGVTSVGVHLNCFVRTEHGNVEVWMARRASTKSKYPSKWDPTVAGGLPVGMGLFENVIKEAEEEAGIPNTMVTIGAKSAGVLSQMTCCSDGSCLKQSLYFIWDMEVDKDFIPHPADGEVDKFERWSVETLESEVRQGERLRPAMRLVATDFLIRHGVITPDREPQLVKIQSAMHQDRYIFPHKGAIDSGASEN